MSSRTPRKKGAELCLERTSPGTRFPPSDPARPRRHLICCRPARSLRSRASRAARGFSSPVCCPGQRCRRCRAPFGTTPSRACKHARTSPCHRSRSSRHARITRIEDYPWGPTEGELIAFLDKVASDWGGPLDIDQRIPTMANDSRFAHWWARFLRQGATPKALLSLAHANRQIDIRDVLPSVRVPTLILRADADRIIEAGHGRYLAGPFVAQSW